MCGDISCVHSGYYLWTNIDKENDKAVFDSRAAGQVGVGSSEEDKIDRYIDAKSVVEIIRINFMKIIMDWWWAHIYFFFFLIVSKYFSFWAYFFDYSM